ncbi:MAG TPA: hypothetical protein VHC20_04915 [Candidatus Paceibacterota bacterium]|nr:hypothetical protein [Candidatus Paceibacterota bacterium]
MEKDKKNVCPHCKQEVDLTATRCPHCGGKIYRWTWSRKALAAIIVLGVIFIATAINSTPTPSAPAEPQLTAEELAAWQATPAGKICTKHVDWTKDDCDGVAKNQVWIGMTYDMLVYENGKPTSKNISNYGSGNRYQYCWTGHTPSCYYDDNADGIIDSYN